MERTYATIGQRVVCVLVFLLCVAAVVVGQQNDGKLQGRVFDEKDAVVTGANVAVVGAVGSEKTTATNGEGAYSFSGLSAGKYIVRVSAPGFASFEAVDVDVSARGVQRLDVHLRIELREEVTVSNDNAVNVDPDRNASATILRGKDLDILSDDPDQLADDLNALAATDGPSGAQIFVDGFSRAKLPSKSSILEVRINSNPFTAEQDDLGFGRIDIVTKPGAEKFSGQGFMSFNDESLNARNPYAPNRAPFQTRLYGASLAGPIVAKKLSFFTDIERRDIDENAIIDAVVLDPFLNPTPFRQVILTPQRRTNFAQRFDYQLNPKNTLVGRYNFGHFTQGNSGVGGFSLPSRAYDTAINEHTFQLSNTMIVNTTTVNQTRFRYSHSRRDQDGSNAVVINVQDSFIDGGSAVGLAFNKNDSYELSNITTWLKGAQTWNFGARLRGVHLQDSAPANFAGTFVFASLDQYRRVQLGVPGVQPAQFTLSGGNPLQAVRQTDLGVFAQNDWRVRPDFTLSLGVRVETQTNINDRFDFAPRVAFAWSPKRLNRGKSPTTVIRGGGGLFYYRFGEDLTLDAERFNGINQQRFIVDSPQFFPIVPPVETLLANALPQTTRHVADDLKVPYSIKGAISVEHQLRSNLTLSVIYIYERDRQLIRSRNINAPLPGTFNINLPGSGVRPFGDVGNLYVYESGGKNTDNTVFMSLNGRLHKRATVFTRLGFSHETGDTEDAFSFPANSYDTSAEYGRVSGDVRVYSAGGVTVSAPWKVTLNGLFRFSSPGRFNITTGRDTNGDGVFTERPAFATNLAKPGVIDTRYGAFDLNPASGQPFIPRNYGTGPSFAQVHLRATRSFRFGSTGVAAASGGTGRPAAAPEKPYNLTVSITALNIFNHVNAGPIIGNLSSPLFGESISTAGTHRRIDLLLRLSF